MQFLRLLIAISVSLTATTAFPEVRRMEEYNSIVERNPFGLKDPPPPPAPVTNNVQKDAKKEEFYLTGISTIGDPKRPKAYLLSKDAGKKDYDQKYFNLTVGDRQGDLSLLEVDPKGRRVRVAYLGEEKWLSMKENGVPAPAGPAPGNLAIPNPGAIPGQPGAVPVPLPNAGSPQAQSQPLAYPNASSPNRRVPRIANNGYSPGGYGGAMGAGMGAVGTQNGNGVPNIPQGPQTDADVAAQIINMHANHQRAIQQGEPAPPLPPLPQ